MSVNNVFNNIIDIWNDKKISCDQKEEKIFEYFKNVESNFNECKVKKLIKRLKKEGVTVDVLSLWNSIRP